MRHASRFAFDTQVFFSLYYKDDRSAILNQWRAQTVGGLRIHRLALAELANTLARHSADAVGLMDDVETDLATGRLVLEDPPWRAVWDRCRELSLAHAGTIGTRTLDVLHVACALSLPGITTLITYDMRCAALAKAAGLRVEQPGDKRRN
jgi:predicted nucleic acid-binding protein